MNTKSIHPSSRTVRLVPYKGEQSETTGAAGAIGQAGGAFGKLGAAKEAEYFHKEVVFRLEIKLVLKSLPDSFICSQNQQVEQLKKLARKNSPSTPNKTK